MLLEDKELYEFGPFRLDVGEHTLTRSDGSKNGQLPEKAFQTLCVLVQKSGHLLTKQELLDQIWPDSFVEENNLDKCIHAIRLVLGEKPGQQKYIETVRKHGYRFVAEVRHIDAVNESDRNGSTIHSDSAPISPAGFRGRASGVTGHSSNAVVALSEWQRNKAENGLEESAISTEPEDSVPPPKLALVKALRPNNRLRFAVFASAALLLGAVALGYYFFSPGRTVVVGTKSIAVLPIKPLTADNREPIYELGIADSLILNLSSAKNLIVRELSATRQYAGIEQDAITAGREQKVDYVLASNYQIADGKIRITSQLINVQSGLVEEVFKVEQENSSIFSVQDAVAANIGQSLLKKLNREPNNITAKRYTTNEEAYRLYLLGTVLADKLTREDARKAIEAFEQAVRLDPNYAPAYAGLAHVHSAYGWMGGGGNPTEEYLKAKAAIEKALAIDDNLAEAHAYLGEIKTNFDWDFAGAQRELKRAVELNPNSSAAHRMYALLLGYLGRFDESIAEIKTAIDLEPASMPNHLVFGRSLLFARRYDEAITELERAAEIDPEFYFAHLSLSVAYRFKGDDDRAFESFVTTRILDGEEPNEINLWKTIYAKSGWQGILARQLERARVDEKNGKPNYKELADLSIELGQREQAFAYLEKAIGERQWGMVLLNVHPRFDSLRSDPRFDDLVRRVGLK